MPRDKFAAMASRASNDAGSSAGASDPGNAEHAKETDSTNIASPAQAPRRDKFAAMASRSSSAAAPPAPSSRGNKFAAMSAASTSAAVSEEKQKNDEAEGKEKRLQEIKEKLSKRKRVLENLDRAEDLTCKLLEVAHQTTRALEDLTCAPDISELSRSYRETLRELHPLLSTDTEDLIRPYQNHSTETKQSMYAARVEMRLAKERTQVLKMITELEKNQRGLQQETVEGESKKRPLE